MLNQNHMVIFSIVEDIKTFENQKNQIKSNQND